MRTNLYLKENRGETTDLMRLAKLRPSKNYKSAKARTWKYFSRFIRLRDSEAGLCKCITCDKVGLMKTFHAGHYMIRDKPATFLDEKNVNAQCVRCNTFQAGMQHEHGLAIDLKYGIGTAENLRAKSKMKAGFTRFGFDELTAEYKMRVKDFKASEVPF